MAAGGRWKAHRRRTGVAVHAGTTRAERARLFLVAALIEGALQGKAVDWEVVVHPAPPTLEVWVPSERAKEIGAAQAVVKATLRDLG